VSPCHRPVSRQETVPTRLLRIASLPLALASAAAHATPAENDAAMLPLASDDTDAARWRLQYFTDLVREDVLEFSRLQEIGTMRLFVEVLRERVGSPLSLASIARDLAISPTTLTRYLEILEALYTVFTVTPWHHNVACSLLQSPKVYFSTPGRWVVTRARASTTQWPRCCSSRPNTWRSRRAGRWRCTICAPRTAPRWTLRSPRTAG
jgi:hypothetical protein